MLKYYEKTSCRYLIWCVPSLIFFTALIITSVIFYVKYFSFAGKFVIISVVLLVVYLIMVVPLAVKTYKERKNVREIIECGTFIVAQVISIQAVRRKIDYSRGITNDEKYLYRIVAERIDGDGIKEEYLSDLIHKRAIKTITKEVKIYKLGENTSFVWEETDTIFEHEIEETLEKTTENYNRKAILAEANKEGLIILMFLIATAITVLILGNKL